MRTSLLVEPDAPAAPAGAPAFDAPWHDAIDAIIASGTPPQRVAGHGALADALPGLIGAAQTHGRDPAAIDLVALHKGQFHAFDPAFLAGFLNDAVPIHANAVFIVLARHGEPLDPRHPHCGALATIRDWLAQAGHPLVQPTLAPEALETPEALDAMARLIARRLMKPIDPADPLAPLAIAETAERFNDSAWFWIDDAGKAAELFALPRLRAQWPHVAEALIDQILALSPGTLMHRRMALPELRLSNPDPAVFAANNAFFSLTGDLGAGVVRPSIRYNDGRERFIGEFAGHSLHFTWGLKRHSIDVEPCIDTTRIDHTPEGLVFEHGATIRAEPLLGPARDVARLIYRYCLRASEATIRLEVVLKTLPGVSLGDVEVTTALDQLSRGGAFNQVWVGAAGNHRECAAPSVVRADLHNGPAETLSVVEGCRSPATGAAGTDPGFAIGFHLRFGAPQQVRRIVAQGSAADRFHWIRVFHALGDCGPCETARLSEERLVTGGGFYSAPARYAALFDSPSDPRRAIDPAMSYDLGAELNAIATTLLFARDGAYDPPLADARVAQLRDWFDRHSAAYREALAADHARVAFVRGLGFAVMAHDAMARAFPDCAAYRAACAGLAARLRDAASAVIDAPDAAIFTPFLDCQAAAILGLVRALPHCPDDRDDIAALIARALRAIQAGKVSKALFGRGEALFDTLFTTPGTALPPVDAGFWVFKLGLVLRALAAVRLASAALPDWAALSPHVDAIAAAARHAIARAARIAGDEIEILTAEGSTETNSETQPWAALGLVPAIETALAHRAAQPETAPPAPPHFAEFDRMAPPLAIEWQASPADRDALLARVGASWAELGAARPHWSVMSNPDFVPERIDQTLPAFHASGAADCDRLCATLRRLGRDPGEFAQVLEFGCGVGRITNHLAARFAHVSARDVSLPHLALARAHSAAIGLGRIDYAPAGTADFGMTAGFDLWFSVLVLQHNPPPVIAAILSRAFALLNPGGMAVFQVPTYAHGYRYAVADHLAAPREAGAFEMHCLPQPAIFALAVRAGCVAAEVVEDHVVGDPAWTSTVFAIARPA